MDKKPRWASALALVTITALASPVLAQSPTIETVEIGAGAAQSSWRAAALEETIRRQLGERDLESDDGDVAVPLTLRGTLERDVLRFEIVGSDHLVLTGGVIGVRDTSISAVTTALGDATRSIDDALAQRSRHVATLTDVETTISAGVLVLLLLGCALFVGSPLLISLAAGCPWRQFLRLRSLHATAAWCLALAAFALTASSGNLEIFAANAWLVYIGGGVFWGWFVAANARIVFPAFHGLSRVEHRDVFRMLRVWAWVALLRILRRAVFYAPFFFGLWLALGAVSSAVTLSTPAVAAIIIPVWGLLARFWFLSVVDNLAGLLDRDLVVGEATAASEWHEPVRGYFLGYVKRLGWEGAARLLDRILFLPGRGSGVHLYGGGLTHSRIVIGTDLLEFALAPYGRPHDYAPPREDKLFWSDWHAGLIVPHGAAVTATREQRTIGHHAEPGEIDPIRLGQPPTLAGFVEPSALDTRHSHRPTEDPTWLEWDPGNDFDGTDPGDHDFLFGALVRELGLIHRFDDQRLTLATVLAPRVARAPAALRRIGRAIAMPYTAVFGRAHTVLGDAYAALNFARHHLVQHLAWQLWREEDRLTARAFQPELERHSEEIFAALERGEAGAADAEVRERLVWLSSFSHMAVTTRRARWLGRLVAAGVAAALVTVLAQNVMRSINYHPVYLDRIESPPADDPDDQARQP